MKVRKSVDVRGVRLNVVLATTKAPPRELVSDKPGAELNPKSPTVAGVAKAAVALWCYRVVREWERGKKNNDVSLEIGARSFRDAKCRNRFEQSSK